MRRYARLIAMTALVIGCGSVGPAATPVTTTPSPSPMTPAPSAVAATVAPSSAKPSPAATPLPTAPSTAPLRLDWARGRFPPDFGCLPGRGCAWGFVPAFGGLVLYYCTADPKDQKWHWAWAGDGRHWRPLEGLPLDTVGLQPDGTATGAFAFTETYVDDDLRDALWRTVDAGASWEWVADTTDWGRTLAYATSNGHHVLVANGDRGSRYSSSDPPIRLFASEDGRTWDEITVPYMAHRFYVRIDGTEAGFIAQWQAPPLPDESDTASRDQSDLPYWFSTSSDGRTWSDPLPFPGEADLVYRVSWGFVALEVKGSSSSLHSGLEGGLVAAWTSADGTRWTRRMTVGQPSREDNSMLFEARIYQVPGGFLLDMFLQDNEPVFFSGDGVSWVKVNWPKHCGAAGGSVDGDTARWGSLVCFTDLEFQQAQVPSP